MPARNRTPARSFSISALFRLAALLLACLAAYSAASLAAYSAAKSSPPLAWRDLPALPALPTLPTPTDRADQSAQEQSSPRPLLLITGFAMTAEGWDQRFVRDLNAGRRVILMENRGMGAAAGLPGGEPVDPATLAADAVRLLDALGIDRADVLGWSMGGGVALELALAHPERVGALVLYAPPLSGPAVKPALDRMFAMSAQELKAALFPQDWAGAHPDVWQALPRPAPLPEGMAARQYAALCAWPGVVGRLPGLRVPALFLAGEDDWVCPAHDVRLQAEAAPGARLEVIPQGGHWMMHQVPVRLARLAAAFLDARR